MSETRYTPDHTWARRQVGTVLVGLTSFAVDTLGTVAALHLPRPGQRVDPETSCATVESAKAASDVCAPVAGRVAEVNVSASTDPGLVSQDPEGAGWLYEMTPDDPDAISSLMDAAAYRAFTRAL